MCYVILCIVLYFSVGYHVIWAYPMGFCWLVTHVFTSFLRGLFQYGDLHLGHCFGCSVLSVHVFPHRWHFPCGRVIFFTPLCGIIIII